MSTGDRLDLEGIRQRIQRHASAEGKGARDFLAAALAADVPALVDEVERLNERIDKALAFADQWAAIRVHDTLCAAGRDIQRALRGESS